jgi:RepB DNA-primase from phage plasmid
VIASGSRTADVPHLHAWWALKEPLDSDALVAANRRVAHALGSDPAVTDPSRVMRVAGTRN